VSSARKRGGGHGDHRGVVPLAEWLVATAGLLVVLATFAILLNGALDGDDQPPSLLVQVDSLVRMNDSAFAVMFTARNDGGRTAIDVVIEGSQGSGEARERGTVTLDYLPARSTRQGVLLFSGSPADAPQIRVAGFRE